jgi:ABC-type branched-subunit amino acid transport system ATPase component
VFGDIAFAGKALARLPAHRVARAGLILVPEGRQVFPRLTVAENLRLGATRRGDFDESEIEAMLGRFPRCSTSRRSGLRPPSRPSCSASSRNCARKASRC